MTSEDKFALADLIARLRKAKEPDRELDGLIVSYDPASKDVSGWAPRYTASFDESIAFALRILPEIIGYDLGFFYQNEPPHDVTFYLGGTERQGEGYSPSTAVLIAALTWWQQNALPR